MAGCVTSRVDRIGRARLIPGTEGLAPVVIDTAGYASVASLAVDARLVDTTERRLRHLQRRASLLGCDAIAAVEHAEQGHSSALCLKAETQTVHAPASTVVRAPTTAFLAQLEDAGSAAEPLRIALAQARIDDRSYAAWPLIWYTENYPASPWHAQVEALFGPAGSGDSALLRAGPEER